MTKEQIEKEAKSECFMLTVNTIGIDQRDVELAYILGRNKSIEQIEALKKENKELKTVKIPQLERRIASIRGCHSVAPLSIGTYVNLSNREILPPINPEFLPFNL